MLEMMLPMLLKALGLNEEKAAQLIEEARQKMTTAVIAVKAMEARITQIEADMALIKSALILPENSVTIIDGQPADDPAPTDEGNSHVQ